MPTPESDGQEIQRVREALAVAEATLDTMIADVAAGPDPAGGSTELSQERVDALAEEIGRLRRQVDQLKDRL